MSPLTASPCLSPYLNDVVGFRIDGKAKKGCVVILDFGLGVVASLKLTTDELYIDSWFAEKLSDISNRLFSLFNGGAESKQNL